MKLYSRLPKGGKIGFREPADGKVNKGYKLQFTECDIDIPQREAELMLKQNPHIVSKEPGVLADHLAEKEERQLSNALELLKSHGYDIDTAKKTVTTAGFKVDDHDIDNAGTGDEKPIDEMNKSELQELAKSLDIPFTGKDSKDILIERIEMKQQETAGE